METYHVSSSPHIRSQENVTRIMGDVVLALVPAGAMSVYLFGLRAFLLIAVSILSAVAAEALFQKVRRQRVSIDDLSAVVTGFLLALNLPAGAPLWLASVGSIFAIIIVKQIFGGLGQNFMNPALGARVFLLISYPKLMGQYLDPLTDAIASATPMAILKSGDLAMMPDMMSSFLGTVSGSLGETSVLALLAGGIYLLVRKVITWEIPVIYLGTVFALSFLFYGMNLDVALFSLLNGGLMLGAFFMATDYSSSPVTKKAQILYALGLGLLTVLIRRFGAYPEGVMFAILLMNALTPAIETFSAPKVFGGAKK